MAPPRQARNLTRALASILFLYRDVLGMALPWMDGIVRAKRPRRLPTVLSVRRSLRCSASFAGAIG